MASTLVPKRDETDREIDRVEWTSTSKTLRCLELLGRRFACQPRLQDQGLEPQKFFSTRNPGFFFRISSLCLDRFGKLALTLWQTALSLRGSLDCWHFGHIWDTGNHRHTSPDVDKIIGFRILLAICCLQPQNKVSRMHHSDHASLRSDESHSAQ